MTRKWQAFVAIVAIIVSSVGVLGVIQAGNDVQAHEELAQALFNETVFKRQREERTHQINKINLAQCEALQKLYELIRDRIKENEKAILTTSYYKEHPDEREEALRRNNEAVEDFRAQPCPKDVLIDPDSPPEP